MKNKILLIIFIFGLVMLFIFKEKKDYNDLKKLEDTKSIIVGDLEAFELSWEKRIKLQ